MEFWLLIDDHLPISLLRLMLKLYPNWYKSPTHTFKVSCVLLIHHHYPLTMFILSGTKLYFLSLVRMYFPPIEIINKWNMHSFINILLELWFLIYQHLFLYKYFWKRVPLHTSPILIIILTFIFNFNKIHIAIFQKNLFQINI